MPNISKSLNTSKTNKQDEFYTRRETIEDELQHYASAFEDKIVYCNCDDPMTSEFWKFFVRVFRSWHLKKLMATHYETNEKNFAYKLELTEDTNGDGKIDWNDEPVMTQLPCNGDFRNAACIELLKEADIVVTNPPFSLFRDYIGQLIEYHKDFLIIGNLNAVTYKEVFPLLMENKVWLGYHNGHTLFRVPDYYKIPDFYDKNDTTKLKSNGYVFDENGKLMRNLGNICWFTNIDIPKRHQPLDLRGNYYKPENYPHYDNYNAIEVSKVENIPCDYAGVMGVPISFIHKYDAEQFQILGMTTGRDEFSKSAWPSKRYVNAIQHNKNGTTANGSKANTRATIRNDEPKGVYYTADNADGKLEIVYARILIQLKEPEQRRFPDEY